MRLVVVATLTILGLAASALFMFAQEPIKVIAHSDDDELTLQKRQRTILHIRSPDGVGSATVTRNGEPWQWFEVRLYLNALEGFVVRTADEVHRLEISSDRQIILEPANSDVLHMNEIPAIEKGGYFSIAIYPENLAEPVSEFRLEWVDFYR